MPFKVLLPAHFMTNHYINPISRVKYQHIKDGCGGEGWIAPPPLIDIHEGVMQKMWLFFSKLAEIPRFLCCGQEIGQFEKWSYRGNF